MADINDWLRLSLTGYADLLNHAGEQCREPGRREAWLVVRSVERFLAELTDKYNLTELRAPLKEFNQQLRMRNASINLGICDAIHKLSAVIAAYAAEIGGSGLTVLMVTDTPAKRSELMEKLQSTGLKVVTVGLDEVFTARADQSECALIILDQRRLGEKEMRQILALRSDQTYAALPLILIDHHRNDLMSNLGLLTGIELTVSDPVDPIALSLAAVGIIRRRLEVLRNSRIDPLTGLPNRASFIELFNGVSRLSEREQKQLTVAMIDIDFFKSVNDRYGHEMGDRVLVELARVTSDIIRKSDFIARWGGEEFLLLFPNTVSTGGKRALEKVLSQFSQYQFRTDEGRTFSVTFSGGVTEYKQGMSLGEVVGLADRLLYLAKKGGRNQIVSDISKPDIQPIRTIILASDDREVLVQLKGTSGGDGYRIIEVLDWEQFESELLLKGVVLVVMGTSWNGLNCYELLDKLRQMPVARRVQVVFIGASEDATLMNKGFDLGVSDFIIKPYTLSELSARVKRALPREPRG